MPGPLRDRLLGVANVPGLRRRVHRPRWGNLRRLEPFSHRSGHDRGSQTVDRYYIDRFVTDHRARIRGRVLEVADRRYACALGQDIVTIDVLDVDPRNALATVVVDLDDHGALPIEAFDCVILTQTLQYVQDPRASLRTLWGSLAPGGTLLISAPAAAKVDHTMEDRESWRILPVGMERLLSEVVGEADRTVAGHGNLIATVAFLYGLAVEELSTGDLDVVDPSYPLVTTAIVTKREHAG